MPRKVAIVHTDKSCGNAPDDRKQAAASRQADTGPDPLDTA